jgi:hypothetical protein
MALELSGAMIAIDWMCEVVGKTGPIYLDTRIIDHAFEQNDPLSCDVITVGKNGKVITIKDVKRAFDRIQNKKLFKRYFELERTYVFEGINRKSDQTYQIMWGS